MDTPVKDLGVQSAPMTFQQMVAKTKEKRTVAPQAPPHAVAPIPQLNQAPPPPVHVPVQQTMEMPHPSGLPMAPVQKQVAPEPPVEVQPVQADGKVCLNEYQKELLVLACLVSAASLPMAQQRLSQFQVFQSYSWTKAIATGVIVTVAFATLKRFVL